MANGGAHAVHRGITATNYHHLFAFGIERGQVDFITKVQVVGRCQVIQRLYNARKARARCAQPAFFVYASGDQHRIMLFAQRIKADIGAHIAVGNYLDPTSLQPLNPAHHHVFLKLKARDAIGQQAASAVVAVINRYAVALGP